jgi:hypothetical protein
MSLVCVCLKYQKNYSSKKALKLEQLLPSREGLGVCVFNPNFRNKPKTINFVMKIVYI